MNTNHKPSTELPWHLGIKQAEQIIYDASGWAVANGTVYHGHADTPMAKANAAYIAHAANAYPKLVIALRDVLEAHAGDKLNVRRDFSKMNVKACADKLIHQLGEEVQS